MTPGGRIDPARAFTPLAIAVLTISDSRDATSDTSGDLLAERIGAAGHAVGARALVRDDKSLIQQQLRRWVDDPAIDVVITTGRTGLPPGGVPTPQPRPWGALPRGPVIYALPGSSGPCRDGWDRLIRPQLDSRHRP